jgi:hypothetical protein
MRGSEVCCASARLAKMAVSVMMRNSFFMRASKNPICTGSERGAHDAGKDAFVLSYIA